jgi:hypothetical protein
MFHRFAIFPQDRLISTKKRVVYPTLPAIGGTLAEPGLPHVTAQISANRTDGKTSANRRPSPGGLGPGCPSRLPYCATYGTQRARWMPASTPAPPWVEKSVLVLLTHVLACYLSFAPPSPTESE